MKNTYKLTILSLIASLMVGLSLPVSAQAQGANQCALGQTCNVPDATGWIYFHVTKGIGTTYTCELKAQSSRSISAVIYGDNNFQFVKQEISADKSGTTTIIRGYFSGDTLSGQLNVRQSVSMSAHGTVMCRAGG